MYLKQYKNISKPWNIATYTLSEKNKKIVDIIYLASYNWLNKTNKGVRAIKEKDLKTTEAQRRAAKKYKEANKEKQELYNKKSKTKSYISEATAEQLQEVKAWIVEREKEI